MIAVTFTETGGPGKLEVIELPDPVARAGEVLVAVQAATINPVDSGALAGNFGTRMPAPRDGRWIVGWDLAGRVTAVGAGVDDSLVGRYVLGFSQWFGTSNGTQASVVALPLENVAVADESISPEKLTTLGLNALTALQGIELAGVTEGTTLIVSGAAGAVGGFAVELAVARGGIVTGYASEKDRETVLGFGARHFVAREDGVLEGLELDAAFDPAGAGPVILSAVRDGGFFITPAQPVEAERGVTVERVGVKPNKEQLQLIADLASEGTLSLRVAAAFQATEAEAAYEKFAEEGLRGRVVLTF
ncbi:MAG: putative oxidoreductase [Microbacteriaceae bacterium]|nr:putative oxidoreductase [Microbacteriaceae bacterium]